MTPGSTIFALSSGPGRAGIAVIRVSGPAARDVLSRMAPTLAPARHAAFRTVRHPRTGEAIDRSVVIFFEAASSETGEDVAELQVHGGRAVVAAVLDALGSIPGCRPAEPGEFARRAFENGKIDLAQVEGLADLVDAETEAQRRQALGQSSGALSKLYDGWRADLIEISGLVEASIDFSDEADVSAKAFDLARTKAVPLAQAIAAHLDDGHRGEILRDGFRVALLGPPNAGKSSLLNALARRDAAIVSEEAGTTRDVIEVRLDLAGLAVIVSDTAGIRETQGAIEQEGIRRSLAAAKAADLVIWLSTIGQPTDLPGEISRETALKVGSKSDLPVDADISMPRSVNDLLVSAKTGVGIDVLVAKIAQLVTERLALGTGPPLTRERHRRSLVEAQDGLQAFLSASADDLELRAEDLRKAVHELGRITGRVDVEDILGEIFSRFCIGK